MKIGVVSSVEQHASWIASNPVVGCPLACAYCFLKPEGLTGVKPRVLFTPEEALDELVTSQYYRPNIPVAVGTRTDFFSTSSNVEYLRQYVALYNKRHIPNPLVIITKKEIPDHMISLFKDLEDNGSAFIFFLSYSGIPSEIEKGIDQEGLRQNFRKLSEAGCQVIHYWRPFIPQNSSEEIMDQVLGFAVKYSKASIVTGLKLSLEMKKQFWFWEDIGELEVELSEVEGIWPVGVREKLDKLMRQNPEHSLGYASSCAIARILGIPDYNGFHDTDICRENSCPHSQRAICANFFRGRKVTREMVDSILAKLGLSDAEYLIGEDGKTIFFIEPMSHDHIVNITQSLNVSVRVPEKMDNGSYWGSSVSNRKPLYIDHKK